MKKTMLIVASFLFNAIGMESDCVAMNVPGELPSEALSVRNERTENMENVAHDEKMENILGYIDAFIAGNGNSGAASFLASLSEDEKRECILKLFAMADVDINVEGSSFLPILGDDEAYFGFLPR